MTFKSQFQPFQWFPTSDKYLTPLAANHFPFYFSWELFSVMLLEGHIFSLIISCILISSSLGNVFDSEFWSIREVILKNRRYLCVSNSFENGLTNYFSRTQIFVTYKYTIIFRIVFFRFSLYILIHRYGTKVADQIIS